MKIPYSALNPSGGWRKHKPWDKRDIIHLQNRDEAISKAREILKRYKEEIKLIPKHIILASRNSYWRDPFPPRNY